MKIEDNRKEIIVRADSLHKGDAFMFDGHLHIKIADDCLKETSLKTFEVPTVDLHENSVDCFRADTMVQPVKAKAVIE